MNVTSAGFWQFGQTRLAADAEASVFLMHGLEEFGGDIEPSHLIICLREPVSCSVITRDVELLC